MTDCEHLRELLGGYVLGGLDPAEMRDVEEHLERCATCHAEHTELASTSALLDLARDAPPDVPARVRDRVVAAAASRRTSRRWTLIAAALVTVAALVGGVVGSQLAPSPEAEIAVPLQSVEPFESTGWATFRVGDDHIVLQLEIDGLEPLPDPEVYEAWLYTPDERIVSIGQLTEVDEVLTVELTVPGSMDDYRGFWITAEPDRRDPAHEGPTVLRAPVPDGR